MRIIVEDDDDDNEENYYCTLSLSLLIFAFFPPFIYLMKWI